LDYPRIVKGPREEFLARPNLSDYQKLRDEFKWEDLSAELDWFDADHINIAHIAVDTHLKTDRRDKKALIWESQKGEVEEYTFADLSRLSNKFANVLIKEIGVNKGDRIFFFMERIPEIFIGILGALKAGAVIGPLFSAFGPDAVKDRLVDTRHQPRPEKESR
jgi:acetyl-CoA synthetase